jgi:hypothetical protein
MPQVKLLQTCAVLLQLAAVWQLPAMQAFPWQMYVEPYFASLWQVASLLPHPVQVCDDRSQTWPVPQPALSWQVPVTQTPLLQMWPVPYSLAHCVSPAAPALHAPHVKDVCEPQIVPVVAQSPFTRQLPAMQAPALQTWFEP